MSEQCVEDQRIPRVQEKKTLHMVHMVNTSNPPYSGLDEESPYNLRSPPPVLPLTPNVMLTNSHIPYLTHHQPLITHLKIQDLPQIPPSKPLPLHTPITSNIQLNSIQQVILNNTGEKRDTCNLSNLSEINLLEQNPSASGSRGLLQETNITVQMEEEVLARLRLIAREAYNSSNLDPNCIVYNIYIYIYIYSSAAFIREHRCYRGEIPDEDHQDLL